MRCCVQRVKKCSVNIGGRKTSEIKQGFLVLVGIAKDDIIGSCDWLAKKICSLRVFENEANKMSKNLLDINGEIMIVSQFTLVGDVKKGRRPDFNGAKPPIEANNFYEYFVQRCKEILGDKKVKTGIFGKKMEIELTNDGPVTFIIDHNNK